MDDRRKETECTLASEDEDEGKDERSIRVIESDLNLSRTGLDTVGVSEIKGSVECKGRLGIVLV